MKAEFSHGVLETADDAVQALVESAHWYGSQIVKDAATPDVVTSKADLQRLSKEQLIALADRIGVAVSDEMRTADGRIVRGTLIDIIASAALSE